MATNNAINANSTTPLPIVDGGTAVTSVTTAPAATAFAGWDANKDLSANNFLSAYTTTATAAGTTTLTVASTYQQFFTGSTTQTVVMPVASTLALGQSWYIVNNSTGIVTLQSSGLNNILAMPANTSTKITCILTSGTTAASWNVENTSSAEGVTSITGTANQVIASASTGAVTLSLATNIANSFSQVVVQAFTGTGTYTPTSGMKYCIVELVGGGGGGGGTAAGGGAVYASSAGGGAGGYARVLYTAAQIGASKAVTIGAAGTAGAVGNNIGGTGGTTSLGATLVACTGGIGGGGGSNAGGGLGGAGGVPTITTGTQIGINNGTSGNTGIGSGLGTAVSFGGNGGSSKFGAGGLGPQAASSANAGNGFGSGGSGSANINTAVVGGAGTAGYLVVTEYI